MTAWREITGTSEDPWYDEAGIKQVLFINHDGSLWVGEGWGKDGPPTEFRYPARAGNALYRRIGACYAFWIYEEVLGKETTKCLTSK